jgi:PAS domain S-box-containing protein
MDNTIGTTSKRALLLSHFTMENLHEAVFWIESNKRIFQVNEMACKMSGYTREELTGMLVTDINPSSVVMDWPAFWQRLKEEKKIVFEAQHRHKTGYLYDIEITGNFIEMDGQEFSCSIVRDIREKKIQQELISRHISEIELYNSTVKNVRDQIFWIEKNGSIIRVNEAVSRESGFSAEELVNMTVFDLNPFLTKEEWEKGWVETKKSGQQILETTHRNKEGNLYPIEVNNNFITHQGKEYFCSSVRNIRQRKKEEEILRAISEATSSLTGEDYFRELTKFITETLNVRHSMVVSCSEDQQTKLHMLSYVDRKEVLENIEYDTKGTPCEIVMQGKEFFCADKLDEVFPREKGKKSWVAVPIYSPTTKKVIGNIAAFDRIPMINEQNQVAILRIFAARAGAEIERIKAEEKLKTANIKLAVLLKESEERFRDLFEEAPIAYVHETLDSKFIKVNRAALNILGVKPE